MRACVSIHPDFKAAPNKSLRKDVIDVIEIKFEHNLVKGREGAEPTSIGIMV